MLYYAFISYHGSQSRIYSSDEVPAWNSSELYGFENIFVGTEEECLQAIDDEFGHSQFKS